MQNECADYQSHRCGSYIKVKSIINRVKDCTIVYGHVLSSIEETFSKDYWQQNSRSSGHTLTNSPHLLTDSLLWAQLNIGWFPNQISLGVAEPHKNVLPSDYGNGSHTYREWVFHVEQYLYQY